MLKFLTHKLRTHSLNEDNVLEKVEERDSGTESDDEAEHPDSGDSCTDVIMKWNDITDISGSAGVVAERGAREEGCACAPAPARLLPEPDLLYDHHSSEEELEVINGAPAEGQATGEVRAGAASGATGGATSGAGESRRRGASSPPPAAPEKRKWPAHPYLDVDELAARASSDDDDIKVETPVRFRTSPPLEALKPRRSIAASCVCGGAPGGAGTGPAVLAGGSMSPRRRRVPPPPPPRRHRPALDFDKMQQLRMSGGGGGGGGVRSWRASGGAGGELSVFCW